MGGILTFSFRRIEHDPKVKGRNLTGTNKNLTLHKPNPLPCIEAALPYNPSTRDTKTGGLKSQA